MVIRNTTPGFSSALPGFSSWETAMGLPFKILLFVMVDGWALIAHALIANYH